jgi:ferritin-like metal-binding protein YciE
MSLRTLDDLFLDELKDVFDAEKRITKALPKMAKSAATEDLRDAFESHLEETEQHIERLEQVFKHLEKPARGKKCLAMEGLIEEGKELMEEDASEAVLDAGLICAAQKVEHYEISAYGTLIAWSKTLGYNRITKLLEQTLAEEKATDEKLTELAGAINFDADEEVEETA